MDPAAKAGPQQPVAPSYPPANVGPGQGGQAGKGGALFEPGWNAVQPATLQATPPPQSFTVDRMAGDAATQLHQTTVLSARRHKAVRMNGTTPPMSGLQTPAQRETATPTGPPPGNFGQLPEGTEHTALVRPMEMTDQHAYTATLQALGADPNKPETLEAAAMVEVKTVKDVINIIGCYHKCVVRPEMYHICAQVDAALLNVADKVDLVSQNLDWLTSENRREQKQKSTLMLVLQGFPPEMSPARRRYIIIWMMQQCADLCQHVSRQGRDFQQYPEAMFECLATLPVTITTGKEKWSTMTFLTFKGFELRKAFSDEYVGKANTPLYSDATTPVPGKHVQVLYSTPQFQRKLEVPLRILMRALNNTSEFENCNMVPLWKSLTLMYPVDSKDFQADARACASVEYSNKNDQLTCTLHIREDVCVHIRADSSTVDEDGHPVTIWSKAWDDQLWGPSWEEDALDAATKEAMSVDSLAHRNKGSTKGKGKGKHWSHMLVHLDYYNPFPIPVEWKLYEGDSMIPFNWNEYCMKFKKGDEKVEESKAFTFQGKPSTPGPTA